VGRNDHVCNQWSVCLRYSCFNLTDRVLLGYDGSLMNGLEAMDSWNEC
jgi:hypothetical protein